ncbi:MAG: PPOX class F420-dependent oxidoreductase [Anaerolineales bacterium]
MLSEKEIQYLQSQRLARLATVSSSGQPDVVPVGFAFDGTYFFVGGRDVPSTRKYKNVVAGNAQVALTIDDLETVQPWKPRGLRIYGTAEVVEKSPPFGGTALRITPTKMWSWGIDSGPTGVRRGHGA